MLASQNGHKDVVCLLLTKGADVTIANRQYMNCLDCAIEAQQECTAMAIVASDQWLAALRSAHMNEDGSISTPFRRAIKKMPNLAYNTMCNMA